MLNGHTGMPTAGPHRRFLTADTLAFVLVLVPGALWLLTHLGWLGLRQQKGWSVLAAVATVFAVILLTLLSFAISARFRSRFRYSIRSLMLLIIAAAIACGWLSYELQDARREAAAANAVLDAGGSVTFRGGNSPQALRQQLGDEFFSDVESVAAQPETDLFGSANGADPFRAAMAMSGQQASRLRISMTTPC